MVSRAVYATTFPYHSPLPPTTKSNNNKKQTCNQQPGIPCTLFCQWNSSHLRITIQYRHSFVCKVSKMYTHHFQLHLAPERETYQTGHNWHHPCYCYWSKLTSKKKHYLVVMNQNVLVCRFPFPKPPFCPSLSLCLRLSKVNYCYNTPDFQEKEKDSRTNCNSWMIL